MSKTLSDYDRYLPVSDRGRQWGLYVTGAGCGRVPPGGHYPRAGHPPSHEFAWQRGRILHEYQFVYINDGSGWFESRAVGKTLIEAGTVFVLFPGVWHRYRPCETTGWEEQWVGFAGEDADRLQERAFLTSAVPLVRTGSDDLIMHAFTILLDRMRSEPFGFEPLLAASGWELIAAVLSAIGGHGSRSRHRDVMHQAKLILEDQTAGLPVIEDLAVELGLSPSHFQQLFKESTGLSPYQYHLQLKIRRAREMLRATDLPVKQVARILHFESVYHFSTLFKKKTGFSPSQWRLAGGVGAHDAGTE